MVAAFGMGCVSAGPAQAGLADPVGTVVNGVEEVHEPLRDAVDDTVREVTRSADHVVGAADRTAADTADEVVEVVQRVERSVTRSAGARGAAPRPTGAAADVPRHPAGSRGDPTPRGRSQPQHDRPRAAATGAAIASPLRQRAHRARSSRHEAPHVGSRRATGAETPRRLGDGTAGPPRPQDHPCASGSLAVQDLRRCGRAGLPLPPRADTSLPSLGGVPRLMLPTGLALLGVGVVLVAGSRRRPAATAAA